MLRALPLVALLAACGGDIRPSPDAEPCGMPDAGADVLEASPADSGADAFVCPKPGSTTCLPSEGPVCVAADRALTCDCFASGCAWREHDCKDDASANAACSMGMCFGARCY